MILAERYKAFLELCYLGCDGFMYPQCHLQNPELLICTITQGLICLCHDECTAGLLAPCQSRMLNDDIVKLGNISLGWLYDGM